MDDSLVPSIADKFGGKIGADIDAEGSNQTAWGAAEGPKSHEWELNVVIPWLCLSEQGYFNSTETQVTSKPEFFREGMFTVLIQQTNSGNNLNWRDCEGNMDINVYLGVDDPSTLPFDFRLPLDTTIDAYCPLGNFLFTIKHFFIHKYQASSNRADYGR